MKRIQELYRIIELTQQSIELFRINADNKIKEAERLIRLSRKEIEEIIQTKG